MLEGVEIQCNHGVIYNHVVAAVILVKPIRDCLDVHFNLCFAKFWIFFFAKIEYGLYFLDRFDVLILKMIFKK